MSKVPEIPFLKGYEIKPQFVTALGEVIFTDGTNVVISNRNQCEAYGYKYDNVTGTCTAFNYTPKININTNKQLNYIRGAANVIREGTANTMVIGEKNTVNGLTRNSAIIGNNNQIQHNKNNVNVFGTLGEGTADNTIVLGGNAPTDNLGERQSIHLMFGLTTTQGVVKSSYLNNTTESFFDIPENTVMYFHANIIAVRVGGTAAGSTGDYASWVERGVVINKSGTLSIKRERDAIKNSGTVTGWAPTVSYTTSGKLKVNVKGATNMTIEWCSDMVITQIKTGVAL
jgi:hypothetical protein